MNGKIFSCIKFRTMVMNDQADLLAAGDNDSRITGIGKWLRTYGIDELPQFFNVLLGDMSLVGPRPHMQSDNLKFEKIAGNYQLRHCIRPGITGLAQVMGYRGNFTDNQQIERRTAMDLVYAESYGFLLDMKIIICTIRVTFFKKSGKSSTEKHIGQLLPDAARI